MKVLSIQQQRRSIGLCACGRVPIEGMAQCTVCRKNKPVVRQKNRQYKKCLGCEKVFPITIFGKHGNGRYLPRCPECNTKYYSKYLSKNQERRLLISARSGAKRRNLAFTITLSDIVIPERCPILGVRLTKVYGKGRSNKETNFNPSIDRIDPSKGYTPDNIWIISDLANRMKTDATREQLYTFAAGIMLLHQEGKL